MRCTGLHRTMPHGCSVWLSVLTLLQPIAQKRWELLPKLVYLTRLPLTYRAHKKNRAERVILFSQMVSAAVGSNYVQNCVQSKWSEECKHGKLGLGWYELRSDPGLVEVELKVMKLIAPKLWVLNTLSFWVQNLQWYVSQCPKAIPIWSSVDVGWCWIQARQNHALPTKGWEICRSLNSKNKFAWDCQSVVLVPRANGCQCNEKYWIVFPEEKAWSKSML